MNQADFHRVIFLGTAPAVCLFPTSSPWKPKAAKSVWSGTRRVWFPGCFFCSAAFLRDRWASWTPARTQRHVVNNVGGRRRRGFRFSPETSGFPRTDEKRYLAGSSFLPTSLFFSQQTLPERLDVTRMTFVLGPESRQMPPLWALWLRKQVNV